MSVPALLTCSTAGHVAAYGVTAVDAADTLPCGVGVARDARLLRVCSAGEGVDRHLMGLRLVSEAGDEHPFWTDVAVSRSTHWTLSTSNMTPCT